MTNKHAIDVFFAAEPVGTLAVDSQLKMNFRYHPHWLASGFAISLSLPLADVIYERPAHNFFAGLLPEGDYRRFIETLYKVSPDNDYSLLCAIGGDCAGALTIGSPVTAEDAFYQVLDDVTLKDVIKTEGRSAFSKQLRLSLAGAQGKLPIHYEKGIFSLPFNGAASSHIIKFNKTSGEFPCLVENEFLMNRLAFHSGLSVVNCQLVVIGGRRVLICERYDRQRDGANWLSRIHQEDICQALGYSHKMKYEKEGGPTLAVCGKLIKRLHLADFASFIDWILFQFLFSCADGHGKNLSLLYTKPLAPRLAPFYDLICTRAYPKLDRALAMAIGDEYDPDLISARHMRTLASSLEVTYPFLRGRLLAMVGRSGKALVLALKDLSAAGVKREQLQHFTQALTKHVAKRSKLFI